MAVGDFSTKECYPKNSTLHFLKCYFNLRFFLQISLNTASFSLFFKLNIRFLKNIFWDLRSKRIQLFVNEGIVT